MEDSYFDGLDRFCFNVSYALDGPVSKVIEWGHRLVSSSDPDKLDNASSKIGEIALRTLVVLGGLMSFIFAGSTFLPFAAVVLVGGSTLFRAAGFALQKDGFTHIRGSAPEEALKNGQATVMTWNISGDDRSHYKKGIAHWDSRSGPIMNSIRAKDPDVIVFLDAFDVVEDIVDKLGDRYAHFYAHAGKNIFGKTSGCVVVTKCAVHQFSHDDFYVQSDSGINRGPSFIEIKANPNDLLPCARIIGAQLTPDPDTSTPDLKVQKERMDQMVQIVNRVAKEKVFLPTFFVGSLSVDLRSKDGQELSAYLRHSYKDLEPTYLDKKNQWDPSHEAKDSSSEVVSLMKRVCPDGRELPIREQGIQVVQCEVVKDSSSGDLTNYRGIATTIQSNGW